MDKAIKEKANKWLNSNIDKDAKDEITRMLENVDQSELVDSFYKDLEFGTGGLRGIIGIGSSRMNKYTVGAATQGLANYLIASYPDQEISVAIAYDSRIKSDFFAETTASIFSANGIKVYFFKELRPTPELSFAIRHFGCQSGVVLTASHNPKEYNGYKAYWNDGAQMVPPHDVNVIKEVAKITDFDMIKFNRDESKIIYIGEEVDKAYLEKISKLVLSPEAIKNQQDLKIVFSPIHGTGITLVPDILDKIGFKNVHIVEEQAEPDGTFPTVVYPNPEESEAMSLALKEAERLDADIVMLLNGNQTGSLIVYYLIRRWKENNKLDGDQYIVKTIVTTDIIHRIAEKYQVEYFDTLTGFKYIAEIIRQLEGQKQFIGGGEESYGYMIGDFVRDKDAIASCMVIAEMTAWAKDQGKSLMDILIDMYVEFGFYKEKLISIVKKGMSGAQEIENMMVQLRENPPTEIAGAKLVKTIDYQSSVEKDLVEGTERIIDYPRSNVLQFFTANGTKISARPSGTEPKIKFYFSVNDILNNRDDFDKVDLLLDDRIAAIMKDLKLQ
jgi:phosphoglucomutase